MEALMPTLSALHDLGRPFWIVTMILGFVLFWPLGLAALAFLIWSGKMGFCSYDRSERWQRKMERMQGKMERMRERFETGFGRGGPWGGPFGGFNARPSGNAAFDEYRQETLRRLEEEQGEFQDFLSRLRMAKDKAEFDQFMAERRAPRPQTSEGPVITPDHS
jgi:hypothetical protein